MSHFYPTKEEFYKFRMLEYIEEGASFYSYYGKRELLKEIDCLYKTLLVDGAVLVLYQGEMREVRWMNI